MKRLVLAAVLSASLGGPAFAAPLAPALAGLGFLLGDWAGEDGRVADTGGTSAGRSHIAAAAGGAALLREDHTELRDAHGKPAGGFDQIMLIYAEGSAIHADYTDGTHVIHYRTARVTPGRSVAFSSEAGPGRPTFLLTYDMTAPDALTVSFAVAPPGSTAYHPIATGTLHHAP